MKKILLGAAALLLLTACAGYNGPSRGLTGSIDTPLATFSGISTTARDGEKPMGYRKGKDTVEEMYGTWTDGQRSATGIPAHNESMASQYTALTMLCLAAPKISVCNPSTE